MAVTVRFLGKTQSFVTGIESYIWLLGKFVQYKPVGFRKDREWLLRYLASSPEVLFYYDKARARERAGEPTGDCEAHPAEVRLSPGQARAGDADGIRTGGSVVGGVGRGVAALA